MRCRWGVSPGTKTRRRDRAEINAWIVVDPDDTVTIRVAKQEMGQGSLTAMPMIVAEESNG